MPPRLQPAVDEPALLGKRLRPSTTPFSPADDRAISRDWGSCTAAQIAHQRGLSLSAVLYRARHLGLRRASRNWPRSHVEAWLGLSSHDWPRLAEEGLEWWALEDRRGRVGENLVSTTSLARWLVQGNRWQRLVCAGADEFFCREILESFSELQLAGALPAEAEPPLRWEYCKFLGPDHCCRNPFAACHGLFCSNSERYAAGDDPKCESRRIPLPKPAGPVAEPTA